MMRESVRACMSETAGANDGHGRECEKVHGREREKRQGGGVNGPARQNVNGDDHESVPRHVPARESRHDQHGHVRAHAGDQPPNPSASFGSVAKISRVQSPRLQDLKRNPTRDRVSQEVCIWTRKA